MNTNILQINKKDNLIVALKNLSKDTTIQIDNKSVILKESIPAKHKFTLIDLKKGSLGLLYGITVGKATKDIYAGEVINTENFVHSSDSFKKKLNKEVWDGPDINHFKNRTWQGYKREDGRYGTANNWLIIPLVFCQNRNVETFKNAFLRGLGLDHTEKYEMQVKKLAKIYRNGGDLTQLEDINFERKSDDKVFDNIQLRFLSHNLGCGGTNEDAKVLCNLLAGYITNPNVAGVTIFSLGCQKAQFSLIEEYVHERLPHYNRPIYFYEQQQSKSEETMLKEAITQTFIGMVEANKIQREEAGLEHLTIGLECGGSDGFSGISANPCIGKTSDLLVKLGGSVILSEFPELYGVEQEIISRCVSEETADRFIHLMHAYQKSAKDCGSSMDANPSYGNIKDGLITDAIKSAGSAKKGGSSPIQDVQDYPGNITKKGLNLLNTPGNDVESTTGLAGAGANLIMFSTGLGTPTGNPITPTIKISTNTALKNRLPDIIDFDAGKIITGDISLDQAGTNLLELCIKVASGEIVTCAEKLSQFDFIPWKRGISL